MPNDFDTSQYPLGSTHPYVLYNNAGNEDLVVNDVVNETWIDRPPFNRVRKTFYGMEQDFLRLLAASGFEMPAIPYTAGVVIDRPSQLISYGGNLYSVKVGENFPYTLDGTFTTDAPNLVLRSDQALRTELAATGGAALVEYSGRTVKARLDDQIFVTDFGAVGNGVADDTSAVMAAWTAATLQGKALTFPGGTYNGTWGNLASPGFTIRCLGKVELHNTGPGAVLTLSAGASNWYKFRIEGQLGVSGNATSTSMVIQGLHHSFIDIDVRDVPGVAVQLNFGVDTDYRIRVSPAGRPFTVVPATGIVANVRNAGEYVADCRFHLCIEGVSAGGVDLVDARGCEFVGTSEGNGGFGVREQVACDGNTFTGFWCEQNGSNDFIVRSNSTYINCRAVSSAVTNNIEVESQGAKFFGGYLRCINRQGTSSDTICFGVETSDNVSLGIKGPGGGRIIDCVRTDGTGAITSRYTDVLGLAGTFAPTLAGLTTAGTQTYTVQNGYHQIVGGVLHYEINLQINVKDAATAGNLEIRGLPYAANASTNRVSSAVFARYSLVGTTAARPQLVGRILPGGSVIELRMSGPGTAVGDAALTATDFVSGTVLTVSGSYPLPSTI